MITKAKNLIKHGVILPVLLFVLACSSEIPLLEEDEDYMPQEEIFILTAPGAGFDFNDPEAPEFKNVSVHDPSVFRVDDTFYIIGSHMAMASTNDFIQWKQISRYVDDDNPILYSIDDFRNALDWARTDTFWAGDIQQMPDGRFFMYYCTCEGSMPLSAMGLAISDSPTGPFKNQGIFLKSGMNGISEDGTNYNANIHPNVIDPHVFFDSNGILWMVYGSFSGGIFILEMDSETGFPLPNQGYGIHLMGGNHARIEGPYMIFSPETEYYYLFVTFGGLGPRDGYNMRVARSKQPYGPFYDAQGNPMSDVRGKLGSIFDDRSIEPYGTKIMGGYWFRREQGEQRRTTGYLSPGHNSVYFDKETGRYFLIFHTRFVENNFHEVRVHEMFLTEEGWFVVSPFRFDGSTQTLHKNQDFGGNAQRTFLPEHVIGSWKIISHGQNIYYDPIMSFTVNLNANGSISGEQTGSWTLESDGRTFNIILDDIKYTGRLLRSFANDHGQWVMSFTAINSEGVALWGAGVAL